MEDTLRVLVHINVLIKNHLVLILIIMEDTLREQELQVHNIQLLTDYLFHKVNKII